MQAALLNQDQDTEPPQRQSPPAASIVTSRADGQPVGRGAAAAAVLVSSSSLTPPHQGTWDSPPPSAAGGVSGGGGGPPVPPGGMQHGTSWLPDWPMAPAATAAAAAASTPGGGAPPEIELQPIEQPSSYSGGPAMLWDQPVRVAAAASSPVGVTASRLPHTPGYPSGTGSYGRGESYGGAGSYGGGPPPPARSTASASPPSYQPYVAPPTATLRGSGPTQGAPYCSGTTSGAPYGSSPSLGVPVYGSMPSSRSYPVPASPSGPYPPSSLAAAAVHGSLRFPPEGIAYASPPSSSLSNPVPTSSSLSASAPRPQQRLSWPTHSSSSPQQASQHLLQQAAGYHGSRPAATPASHQQQAVGYSPRVTAAAAPRPAAPWREEEEAATSPWACQVGMALWI